MSTDDLKSTLKDLQARISETGATDAELQSLMETLDSQDLQNLQDRQAHPEQSLADTAQELSAKFAAQHPQMEALLRELANLLENIGI